MTTVELAIGILTAGLMTLVAVFVVSLVVVQTRCEDSASAIARQLARGDQTGAAAARSTAPRGAAVSVTTSRSEVAVRVSVTEALGRFGPVHLEGRARAVLEPGVRP